MAANTTKSINAGEKVDKGVLENQIKKAAESFKGEKKVKVSVPKNLQPKIGETLFLSINGVDIVLPVDGTKHDIPETFAEHLQDYLANLTM